MRISRLTLQNAFAVLSLPLYLLSRPLLRLLGLLRPGRSETWIVGGHSGRLYADNAGALHSLLLEQGRDVAWVGAEPSIDAMLKARGARVLRRNSFRARLALENAAVLAYSHGITDMDHVLQRWVGLSALKVHLNHCMSHLKAWNISQYPAERRSHARGMPFDYLLASSERERRNLAQSFVGAGERIVVGGGAHLDVFMRARARQPGRVITYFPTYRESVGARANLRACIDALVTDARLGAWLVEQDYTLYVVGHVNSGAHQEVGSQRVRFSSAQDLTDLLLETELFISDYSGLICDYLAFERPIAFFPFDKAEYLAQRKLYVDYDDFAFGPQLTSVAALVNLIVGGAFRDLAPYQEKRRRWQRELFPELAPIYAERTEATIRALKERHERAG